jgi:flagellar protein FliO/FliZ
MGTPDYIRFILSLAFVLALMGLLSYIVRRTGLGAATPLKRSRRLEIIETKMIDPRHKLSLIQCDNRQYLIILGPDGQTVIDANITPTVGSPT